MPVYHDDSLASLLSQLEAGTEVPPALYQTIVDIYLYFLNYSFDASGKGTAPSQNSPVPAPEKSTEKQIFSEL